jgi:hypothetical protein
LVQLLKTVNALNTEILPVPLIARMPSDYPEDGSLESPAFTSGVCPIYFTDTGGHAEISLRSNLTELYGPPPAYSQMLASIGRFWNEQRGTRILEFIETHDQWLRMDGEVGEVPPLFLMLGSQASVQCMASGERLVGLLDRASVIVVSEQAAFEDIAGVMGQQGPTKLHLVHADTVTETPGLTGLLSTFVNSGYVDDLQDKYRSTLDRLLESMERLSEVQFDYGRLLSYKSDLQMFRGRVVELETKLEEFTAWAQRAVEDVVERDNTIRELQAKLEEQSTWAQSLVEEIAKRDALVPPLTTGDRSLGFRAAAQAATAPAPPAVTPGESADIVTELAATRAELETARRLVSEISSSRGWRLLTRYRQVRDRAKRVLRRDAAGGG